MDSIPGLAPIRGRAFLRFPPQLYRTALPRCSFSSLTAVTGNQRDLLQS